MKNLVAGVTLLLAIGLTTQAIVMAPTTCPDQRKHSERAR